MSIFNPVIPKKHKEQSHHPWENRIKDVYSRTYKYGHNSAKNPVYPMRRSKISDGDRIKFTVIGNRISKEFIYCLYLVKGLHKYRQKEFKAPVIRGLTSIEWPKVWNDLKILYGGFAYCLRSQVAILMDDKFLGGEDELKALIESKYIYYFRLDYFKEAIRQFGNFVKSSGRPFAYLQISINDVPIGTLIFMLYADIVPHTCENFLRLCDTKKGGYAGTSIHRIVEDCWIQCGGFGLKSGNLACENYIVQHDGRGVLCMANNGRHVDCSTQFFVLLQPAPWMEHKYVAFGQLVEGERTLARIEKVPTCYESPISKIVIYNAGVFNMECNDIAINKSTHAYLHGHIENLITIGEMFYDELLEKVFTTVAKVIPEVEEHGMVKNVHSTQRFIRRKEEIVKQSLDTAGSADSEDNDEFDVDVYEYEYEDFSYSKQTSESSIVVKPEKPFYLPFTDVPYPGEVDSTYDLKKLLKGDYCLESDLEKDPAKRRQQQLGTNTELAILGNLLDALLEDYELNEEESDSSLDINDDYEIQNYIKENLDSVSFAGPAIRKIANMKKKYELLKDTDGKNRRLLTDEDLRILRMAAKEYSLRENKKKVRIEPTAKSEEEPPNLRRGQASEPYLPSGPPRQSVLARLYEDVTVDSDDEGPTLKDYKPYSEAQQRNFMLLTHSPTHFIEDDSQEKFRRFSHLEDHSIDKVLWLQHGMTVSRKISSDYVRTIDHIEHNLEMSLRVIDFGKKRPSMSVAQYRLRNQKYKEELTAAQTVSKTQNKEQ